MTGRAIVFTAPGKAELRTIEVPPTPPGGMRVRTECTGVSQGTETWAFTGRRPETEWPTIPGYQGVGIAQDGPLAGRRVVFHKGLYPDGFPESWMGAHQEFAVVESATPVPEGVEPEDAAHFAVVGVALRGLKRTVVEPGRVAVVLGLGLVGQCCAQVLRARGATVLATDHSPLRRSLATDRSADRVFAPDDPGFRAELHRSAPEGADIVVDTTGVVGLFPLWIDLIRPEGEIVMQGWYPEPAVFDFHEAHHKLATIRTPCSWEPAATALEWIAAGKADTRSLVTHVLDPADCGDAYTRMAQADPERLGVMFDWRTSAPCGLSPA